MRSVEDMTNDVVSIMEKNKMKLTQDEKIQLMNQVLTKVLNEHWSLVVPKAIPPIDAKGVAHKRNSGALMAALLEHTVFGKGTRPIRADVIVDVIAALDRQGAFEHYPEIVERIVEKPVPTPLNRRQAEKAAHDLTKKMNDPNRHPVKGHGEDYEDFIKPRTSKADLERQAAKDLSDNETMGDVRSIISMHSHSGSHSATRYEREILTNTMNDGIEKGLEPKDIKANVQAAHDAMANWGPQDALKRLRPELFQTKKQEQW